MYVKNEEVKEINFLASAKYHNYTRQIDNKGVVANAKGRKIVKAGTVYRNSQGVAIGLVFNDVDVTEGPQPGAVMYEGWVLAARLPEKIMLIKQQCQEFILKMNMKHNLSLHIRKQQMQNIWKIKTISKESEMFMLNY